MSFGRFESGVRKQSGLRRVTAFRPKRALELTAEMSELLARATLETLAVVEDDTELRIRGLGSPFGSE